LLIVNYGQRHLVPILTLTIIILHTVPELFITPWDLSVHPWHYYLELNLFAWAHDMLNGFSINPMTVRFGDASLAEKIILVLSVTFTIVRDYVGYVFYILLLISCAGVYEISTKLERSVKDIQKSSCGQIKVIESLWNIYIFGHMNLNGTFSGSNRAILHRKELYRGYK